MSETLDRFDGASLLPRITHPKKRAFLVAFCNIGTVTRAAALAGITPKTHRNWLASDPRYAEAFEEAREVAADVAEDEVRRRAIDGWEEPVIWQGRVARDEEGRPVTVRKYDSTMLIFLMKSLRPERFRERTAIEHSGPGGGPIAYAPDIERKLAAQIAAMRERAIEADSHEVDDDDE